jgi:3D-(3,5/4)-trihydroxycyclohexane-1,2-dione acylhydrolase (decyclizing)
VLSVSDLAGFEKAFAEAQASDVTTVVHVETDPLVPAPDSPAWWDVPVAEVSALDSTRAARTTYDENKARQRAHLAPPAPPAPPAPSSPEGSSGASGHL